MQPLFDYRLSHTLAAERPRNATDSQRNGLATPRTRGEAALKGWGWFQVGEFFGSKVRLPPTQADIKIDHNKQAGWIKCLTNAWGKVVASKKP